MTLPSVLQFVNLFFAGVLAGMEIAIHFGLIGPSAQLSDQAQLRLRQGLVLRLRILVPAFFLPSLISSIALALLDGLRAGFGFRCAGLFAMLLWVALRVVGTIPINSATLSWDANAPPADWKAQVARAERFHDLGVWAVVISFACSLASAAQLAFSLPGS